MSLIDIIVISIALALDAFGVALSLGLHKQMTKRKAFGSILSFGFFQFFLVFIGGLTGCLFNRYVFTLPTLVGGLVILLVGVLMFKEGLSNDDTIRKLNVAVIIVMGISVSIDALVIGFTTFDHFYPRVILMMNSMIVGGITCFLVTIAFVISKHIRRIDFVKEYSDFLGGVILILFGIKMIFF